LLKQATGDKKKKKPKKKRLAEGKTANLNAAQVGKKPLQQKKKKKEEERQKMNWETRQKQVAKLDPVRPFNKGGRGRLQIKKDRSAGVTKGKKPGHFAGDGLKSGGESLLKKKKKRHNTASTQSFNRAQKAPLWAMNAKTEGKKHCHPRPKKKEKGSPQSRPVRCTQKKQQVNNAQCGVTSESLRP